MNLLRNLGLRWSVRRVIVFAVLSVAAAILTLLFVSAVPPTINVKDGAASITFAATRTALLPNDCVRFDWNVDHVQAVYFNKQGVTAPASRELCSLTDITSTLQVIYQDGSTHLYTLSARMLLDSEGAFALLSFGLLMLMFGIWLFVPSPRDYLLITGLIFISAVPLILLRDNPLFKSNLVQGVICLTWLGVVALWVKRGRKTRVRSASKANFYQIAAISGLLLILTVLGYYLPMKQHFYIGAGDEAYNLLSGGRPIWSAAKDGVEGRPYENVQASLAYLLSPDSLDGYLWLALLERFLAAVSVFALLCKFFARSAVPLIAAILFIVWSAEITRYLVVEAQNYTLSLCLFTLAVAVYFHSYSRKKRWQLAVACLLLSISLLIVEASFPLALFIPLLLLIRRRQHLIQWGYAWLATVGLLAARFIIFLLAAPSYQTNTLPTGQGLLSGLPANLWQLGIAPLFSFLQVPGAVLTFGLYGLLTALVAVGLLVLYLRQQRQLQSRPRAHYFLALLVGGVALLSVLPFIPINHYSGEWATQPLYRSQYFATPIQVILWAVVIELAGMWLFSRMRQVWLVGATAVLVILAITGDLQFQANRGFVNRQITFEGLRQSLHDLQGQLPDLPPNTAILLTMGDDVDTPFGFQGHLFLLSCILFNHPAFQGKFVGDGFVERSDDHPPNVSYTPTVWTFKQAVVFNVSHDWQISAAPMPAVVPSQRTQPGPVNCADLISPDYWPPVTAFKGPGLRFFH